MNSAAGTAARNALSYPGRRHPDANLFRRLEQRLRETESVAPTAHATAGRPWPVRTPANEDAAITAVVRQPRRSSPDIARVSRLFQPNVLEVLADISGTHTTTRGAPICFQTIVLYGCVFANGCDTKALRVALRTRHAVNRRSAFYA